MLYTVYSMQSVTRLDRPNLSDDVAEEVREMIVDGRLNARRINEVQLASKLGVSRTPLREALMRLEAEGAIINQPRRGFSVRPLSIEEVEQIYSIRVILDPEALNAAGLPSQRRLKKLAELNVRLMDAADPKTVIALDDKWHLELLADCPNLILIELIEQFSIRTRRYELALMRDRHNVDRAIRDHSEIISSLERGNLARACKALRKNMEGGKAPIINWLGEQEKE
jgi:DNA-binding GntR family transcriptional regulator